jgi:predicted DCC family thiol-disulfide oxidoreductase YuxK
MNTESSSVSLATESKAAAAQICDDKDAVILFYDGTCGFCSRIVQFILKHESSRQSLRFATLQGDAAAALRERLPWLADVDSVVWYEPASGGRSERVLVRSDAGLAAAAYLGGIWRFLALAARWVPRFIRDAVYNAVARNRQRLAGNVICLMPSPQQRVRFID